MVETPPAEIANRAAAAVRAMAAQAERGERRVRADDMDTAAPVMKRFGTYLFAQLPGWLLALVVLWALHAAGAVPAWVATALLGAWVTKDLLLFPVMWRFYQPHAPRIVGETGSAVTDLSPNGFVRIGGELWQARAAGTIAKGARVRVREIHGLTLVVDAVE